MGHARFSVRKNQIKSNQIKVSQDFTKINTFVLNKIDGSYCIAAALARFRS